MFDTDRLTLRAYSANDMPCLMRLANDLEVQRLTWDDYVVPRSASFEETIKGWVHHSLFFAIITLKSTGDFVGNVSLSQRSSMNRDGSLAVTIASEYWNKGYGTEALRFVIDYGFASLALHRISLGVFATNARATAVYTKLGFLSEGTLRKALWSDGEWKDLTLMAILEDEWKKRRNKVD